MVVIKGAYLLAGVDSNNQLALARFSSSYAGTQPLKVLSGTLLGVGLTSTGEPVLLKLSSTGALI